MKNFFYSAIFTAVILVFPSSLLNAGVTDEVGYINEKTDFYIYTNFSHVMNFLAGRGINISELDSLAVDAPAAEKDKIFKIFGLKPSDLNEILVTVHLRGLEKKSGFLVFISVKNSKGHIPESFRKDTVKLKSGTVYKASADEDIVFTKVNDFFVIGSSAYLDSYLEKRSRGKSSLSSRSLEFKSKSSGKSVYLHLTVTGYLIAEMNRLLNSRRGEVLKENIFIKTLLTLESSDMGLEIGDKIVFTSGMRGTKPEDSERLLMITHTWIVGTSFLVSFADMFLVKNTDAALGENRSDRELMAWLQRALGRIRVSKVDRGVVSSFEMAPAETDVVIAFIKNEMEKEKKSRFERIEREKISSLTGAIKQDNFDVVKKYIKEKYNLNGLDTDGNTPLGAAAISGSVRIARLLIEKGAMVNLADVDILTPLHLAVKNDRREMVVFLLGKGADVNAKADNDLTPLHYNAFQGNSEITRLLIAKGAAVNAVDADGSTPLHYASSQGFIKVVRVLVEKKADHDLKNKNNQRAVDVAARNEQVEIVNYFKSSFGQEPESFSEEEYDDSGDFDINDDPDDEIFDEDE